MKFLNTLAVLAICLTVSNSYAFRGDGIEKNMGSKQESTSEPEIVKWVGEVKDDWSTHTTEHKHELEFVKKDDGKKYTIVDSPQLVQLHHESGKNYLMEIEAEKTPVFLFWGGNLIVKSFKVLGETSGEIAHNEPIKRAINNARRDR
jgi:hypothetical protein